MHQAHLAVDFGQLSTSEAFLFDALIVLLHALDSFHLYIFVSAQRTLADDCLSALSNFVKRFVVLQNLFSEQTGLFRIGHDVLNAHFLHVCRTEVVPVHLRHVEETDFLVRLHGFLLRCANLSHPLVYYLLAGQQLALLLNHSVPLLVSQTLNACHGLQRLLYLFRFGVGR